jgi:hypothetical protein
MSGINRNHAAERAAAPQADPMPVVPAEAVPGAPAGEFTYEQAVDLLKGSNAGHLCGYISLAVSMVTLYLNLSRMDGDIDADTNSTAAAAVCWEDQQSAKKLYVGCAASSYFP